MRTGAAEPIRRVPKLDRIWVDVALGVREELL
jgi:hypothetical protein